MHPSASYLVASPPLQITPTTVYTVTATNSGGSGSFTLNITINDLPPNSLSYSTTSFTETIGSPMSAVTPTVSGGDVVTWEIHPTLPSGLSIDSSTGEISGTPTVLSSLTTYTVYANNSGGSATANIDITVNDVIPSSVSYDPS